MRTVHEEALAGRHALHSQARAARFPFALPPR